MRCFYTLLSFDSRVFGEIARTLRRGTNIPRVEYDKSKIEGLKVEIRKILSALNAQSSSRHGSDGVGERTLQPLPAGPRSVVAISASESGKICLHLH